MKILSIVKTGVYNYMTCEEDGKQVSYRRDRFGNWWKSSDRWKSVSGNEQLALENAFSERTTYDSSFAMVEK